MLFCLGGTAGLHWVLTPDFPRSIYFEQVAPDLGHYAVFDGTVYRATFDGAPFIDRQDVG